MTCGDALSDLIRPRRILVAPAPAKRPSQVGGVSAAERERARLAKLADLKKMVTAVKLDRLGPGVQGECERPPTADC